MKQMTPEDRIFVAGHKGLVGSALVRRLQHLGYDRLLLRPRAELDLLDRQAVTSFFEETRPTVVFVAAAKVGGIMANKTYGADFIYENLQVQNNIIWEAHRSGVRRLVFLGSSCIYPRLAPQPMPETCLLSAALEYTNRPYAIAKIAGLELVNSLRSQFHADYFSVMPTNLYGPGDNFDLVNSHVLPALIRRFIEAVESGQKQVAIWGTGKPKREFLYVDDCADAIIHLAETVDFDALERTPQAEQGFYHFNIGAGEDIAIGDLAKQIAELVGYHGDIVFDTTKPDGTPRKLLDISQLESFGWAPSHTLSAGLIKTVAWYKRHRDTLRGIATPVEAKVSRPEL